jgi:hypothetical protein
MKKVSLLISAVLAVFAVSAIASSVAFAESEWLDGGAVITTAVKVLSELMSGLKLEDMGTGVEVECKKGTDEGTVGPGAADTVTAAACTEVNKTALAGSGTCTEVVSITAEGLPWATALSLVGGVLRDTTTNAKYTVKCKTILGTVEDKCETTRSAAASNSESAVLIETDATTEGETSGTCSLGKEPLVLSGSDLLIFSDEGLVLTVS